MTSQPLSSLGKLHSSAEASPRLFSYGLIHWRELTLAEQFITGCVVLTPLWWALGWTYILPVWLAMVAFYEFRKHGTLGLKTPSITVLAAIGFGIYRAVSSTLNSEELRPSVFLPHIASWVCFGLTIWYFESKKTQVRTKVLGWAFSVLVVEMFLFWVVVQLVLKAPHYTPPLSLFGIVTAKGERFIPGAGGSNYLVPYWPDDKIAAGFARFSFFFPVPESLAVLVGFIGLLALDLKNRYWAIPLFLGSCFLLFISGTRSNWITFPIVLLLRYLFVFSRTWGTSFLFGLIALVSFISFSMPPATHFITKTLDRTAEATGNARADSTQVRSLIYERTWEAITTEPDYLMLGRGVPGSTVLPGYEPAKVGSHSFLLGTLLYRSGIVGTALFVTLWTGMILWLYRTRRGRPPSTFLMLLYITITFATMELETTTMLTLIICATADKPLDSDLRRLNHA